MPNISRKKRTYKKRASPKISNAVKNYVQKSIKQTPELQRKDTALSKVELYHNVFTSPVELTSNTVLPSQGDGSTQFSGVKYNLLGYSLRFLFGQKNDRPNVTFRVTIFEVPSTTSITYSDIFENITGNILLDPINFIKCKKIKDVFYKPHNGQMSDASDEYTFTRQIDISYRKKMVLNNQISGKKLYYLIQAYDAYGTLVTDNIAYVQVFVRCNFRDI